MALTTTGHEEFLPKAFSQTILKEAFEQSVVGQLSGTTPVVIGDNVLPYYEGGIEVGVVGEAQAKPVSDAQMTSKSFSPVKVATIVIVSDEMARLNPGGMLDIVEADLRNAVARGFDSLVLHGKDPKTGAALSNGLTGITDTTTNRVTLDTNPDWIAAVMAAYDQVGVEFDANGVALDPRVRAQLTLAAQSNAAGLTGFPTLTGSETNIAGLRGVYGRTVGRTAGVTNNVKAIVGDWSKVKAGYAEGIEVKRSSEASVVDAQGNTVNLWQTNQSALLVEAKIGWIVTDEGAFSVIETADTSEG